VKAIRSNGRRACAWYGVAGLALGRGSYFRLDYLLLPLAMLPPLWLLTRRASVAVAGTTMVMAAVVLALLPWAYRKPPAVRSMDVHDHRGWSQPHHQLGEFENPWNLGPSDLDREAEARAWGLESAWVPEAVPHFQRLWLDSVRSHPGAFVMTMVKRLPIALAPPFAFGFDNPSRPARSLNCVPGMDRYQAVLSHPCTCCRRTGTCC